MHWVSCVLVLALWMFPPVSYDTASYSNKYISSTKCARLQRAPGVRSAMYVATMRENWQRLSEEKLSEVTPIDLFRRLQAGDLAENAAHGGSHLIIRLLRPSLHA
jgi:hypothetical protein